LPKKHGGFRALRHFFVLTLITINAEPKDIQRLLRHKTVQITLRPTSTGGRVGSAGKVLSELCFKPLPIGAVRAELYRDLS
jgi:integrase